MIRKIYHHLRSFFRWTSSGSAETQKDLQLRVLSRLNILPKVRIDGVLTTNQRLALALFCLTVYFTLQNIPLFGLITVLDYVSSMSNPASKTTSLVRQILSSENNIIAATKTVVSTVPLVLALFNKIYKYELTKEEQQIQKLGATSFAMIVNVFRTWYKIFYAKYYFHRHLSPYYVLAVDTNKCSLVLVQVIVALEMLIGGVLLHVIEELVFRSRITSILAIGYLSEIMTRIVSHIALFADYEMPMLYGIAYLLVSISALEHLTATDVKKVHLRSGKFATIAGTTRLDALTAVSESLFVVRTLKDVITNISLTVSTIGVALTAIAKQTLNLDLKLYNHLSMVQWLKLDEFERVKLDQFFARLYENPRCSAETLWFLGLFTFQKLILPQVALYLLKNTGDPAGNPQTLLEQDREHRIAVASISQDPKSQYKYYAAIVARRYIGAALFLVAYIPTVIYGVVPYNLVAPDEFIVNYLRVVSVKNNLYQFSDNQLPGFLVTFKKLCKDIPPE